MKNIKFDHDSKLKQRINELSEKMSWNSVTWKGTQIRSPLPNSILLCFLQIHMNTEKSAQANTGQPLTLRSVDLKKKKCLWRLEIYVTVERTNLQNVSVCLLRIPYREHVIVTIAAWMSECGWHPGLSPLQNSTAVNTSLERLTL